MSKKSEELVDKLNKFWKENDSDFKNFPRFFRNISKEISQDQIEKDIFSNKECYEQEWFKKYSKKDQKDLKNSWDKSLKFKQLLLNEFGEVQVLENERSDDGDHDQWNLILKFHKENLILQICGYYSSNDGANFDDPEYYEVKPKEYTVIRYDIVK